MDETPRESPTPNTPDVTTVGLRNRSWEAYSVIVATVVGLLSLGVSAYTAYTLHVQTRAQVFPYLQIIDLGEQHRVAVYNKGVGPAFVRSVTVDVDGKPVTGWREFFAASKLKLKGGFAYSNVNHVAIAANETLPALIFQDVDDFKAYQAIDPKTYRVEVCYCSVLDECWAFGSGANDVSEPKRVDACKVDPARDFTQ